MSQLRTRLNEKLKRNPNSFQTLAYIYIILHSGSYIDLLVTEFDPSESGKVTLPHRRSPVTTLGLCAWATAKGTTANPLDGGMLTLR
jgi:hypothetical protein